MGFCYKPVGIAGNEISQARVKINWPQAIRPVLILKTADIDEEFVNYNKAIIWQTKRRDLVLQKDIR